MSKKFSSLSNLKSHQARFQSPKNKDPKSENKASNQNQSSTQASFAAMQNIQRASGRRGN
jgi:hypothetical protein